MAELNVVVTGGSGSVGGYVVSELVKRGHTVSNIDKRPPEGDTDVPWSYADLSDPYQTLRAFEGADVVCHLAEIPSLIKGSTDGDVFARNAAIGSNVFECCADLKIKRVIYASSCQVYFAWGPGAHASEALPIDETHPLRPNNGYGASKVANEAFGRYVAEHRGVSVAAMRMPWVRRGKPYIYKWSKLAYPRTSPSDGYTTFVDSEDVGVAWALAAESNREGFEAYNLSSDDCWNTTPMREYVRVAYPDGPQLPEDWPDFKSPLLSDKAKDHFGWQPQVSLQKLIASGEITVVDSPPWE